ncbi:MAG: replication endonuclease [Campylobacteraceae bacterium]|nr:replication endonuclease [Campylobacteraceae bacterium]
MYGLTKFTREIAIDKVNFQKRFLENNFILFGTTSVALSTFVKNAYINSNRYIAEVNHRVWSLYHYANNKGLKNIFGTITVPSVYHKKISNRYYNSNFINDINHTPKAGAIELSRMFKRLLDLRVLRDINKEDKCHFRVYEPHKDGTPHLHFSMFVPENKVEEIVDRFKKYFKLKYKNLQVKFETNINNPVSYLMKYILKTFDDLRKADAKLSDLSLWYIKHSITRFYTSRTLISLDVYRCLNGRYDLLELTQMYKNRELIVYLDTDTNKIASIEDHIGIIYTKKHVTICDMKTNATFKLKYEKRKSLKSPIINIEGIEYISVDGILKVFDPIIPVKKMSSMNLYQHYLDINEDIENYNLHHYGLVKNEMISRELIVGEEVLVSEYNLGFDFPDNYDIQS